MMGSLGGCTVLNSDYANGAGSDTDGVSTSGAPGTGAQPTAPLPTTDSASGGASSSDPNGSGLDSGHSDTSDSDSHTAGDTTSGSNTGPDSGATTGAETGDWPTSGSSGDGSSGGFSDTGGVDSGSVGEQVLFIYATLEPFNFPDATPEEACDDEPNSAAFLCVDDQRYPVLAYEGLTLPAALNFIESAGLDLPVYGINSNGLASIADSPADMVLGLNVSMVEGGVNIDEGALFWTGIDADCADWTAEKGLGTVGSSIATNPGWANFDSNQCSQSRRILCLCESVPDPF